MPRPTSPSSLPDAAESRIRALLAEAKWRQARDELKSLVKADRGRFLPLLIAANVGLARKMLASGQAAEARQVLNYLATIAPAEELRALEVELTVRSGAANQSLPKFITLLADPAAPLTDAERTRVADALVLSFEATIAAEGTAPGQARVLAERSAVHDALRAVSAGQWPIVSECLRRVPHRSAFSHWAIFVKGVAAFHSGEAERALKLLRSVPSESAPGKAGRAYLLLLGDPAGPAWDSAVEGICRLVGESRLAPILTRANQLWREGKHAESYRVFRDNVELFPSWNLDWSGALTEFYFKAPHGMSDDAVQRFIPRFTEILTRTQPKNRVETMLLSRLMALTGATYSTPEDMRENWENFLDDRQELLGPDPRLASLVYGWLGEQFSMTRRGRRSFSHRPRLGQGEEAVAMLRKSIDLDASNLRAHLQLCTVYETLKKTSEHNRLLDEMTRRFPDQKEVLVAAAQGCLERKSLAKGLDYLTRARKLDSLDPQIAELTVAALEESARQSFQKGRLDKARQALAEAEKWLTDKPDDFQRSRWAAWGRHGVLQRMGGDPEAAARLAQSQERAPSASAHLLLAHLAYRKYAKEFSSDSPFLAELKKTFRKAPSLETIGLLIRLTAEWQKTATPLRVYKEEELLGRTLEAAVSQPCTRAAAAALIERIPHNHYSYDRAVRSLVEKILRPDPQDPQFRLWQLSFQGGPLLFSPETRADLQSIIQEATRRRDEAALRQARQMLRDLGRPSGARPDDFDDEEFDEDDEDDDFDPIPKDGPSPLPTPESTAAMEELIEALRFASPQEIRALRQTAGRALPKFMFDALVGLAKTGKLPPPTRPKPTGSGAPPAGQQMNFF